MATVRGSVYIALVAVATELVPAVFYTIVIPCIITPYSGEGDKEEEGMKQRKKEGATEVKQETKESEEVEGGWRKIIRKKLEEDRDRRREAVRRVERMEAQARRRTEEEGEKSTTEEEESDTEEKEPEKKNRLTTRGWILEKKKKREDVWETLNRRWEEEKKRIREAEEKRREEEEKRKREEEEIKREWEKERRQKQEKERKEEEEEREKMRLVWMGIIGTEAKERWRVVETMVERMIGREGRVKKVEERMLEGGNWLVVSEMVDEEEREKVLARKKELKDRWEVEVKEDLTYEERKTRWRIIEKAREEGWKGRQVEWTERRIWVDKEEWVWLGKEEGWKKKASAVESEQAARRW